MRMTTNAGGTKDMLTGRENMGEVTWPMQILFVELPVESRP